MVHFEITSTEQADRLAIRELVEGRARAIRTQMAFT